jgi:hypothetical protein
MVYKALQRILKMEQHEHLFVSLVVFVLLVVFVSLVVFVLLVVRWR